MLITDEFVYIHLAKTGGTFVESMLRKLYEARGYRIAEMIEGRPVPLRRRIGSLLPGRKSVVLYQHLPLYISSQPASVKRVKGQSPSKHGWVCQIPPEHSGKPVLTTVRNPYDRIVSQFEYRNWVDSGDTKYREAIARPLYPHFPDISFAEYVDLSHLLANNPPLPRLPADDQPGFQTRQFLMTFLRNPLRLLDMDTEYLRAQQYRQDLYADIHYTFTHDLNRGLYEFLCKVGFPHDEVAFILDHEKVLPRKGGRSEEQHWQKYFSPELREKVRHHERVLFELFPAFDDPQQER